jgi:hypothetical protein
MAGWMFRGMKKLIILDRLSFDFKSVVPIILQFFNDHHR